MVTTLGAGRNRQRTRAPQDLKPSPGESVPVFFARSAQDRPNHGPQAFYLSAQMTNR